MSDSEIELGKAQELIWLGQQFAPELPLYNMAISYRFDGRIDAGRFSAAIDALVADSDILQTVFVAADVDVQPGPSRALSAQDDIRLPLMRRNRAISGDCEMLELADETALAAWIAARCRQSFDLSQRAFDCALLTVAGRFSVFYWCQHHLISDGSNIELLMQKLERLYQQGADAAAGAGSYYDYLRDEAENAASTRLQRIQRYWSDKVADAVEVPEFYGQTFSAGHAKTRSRLRLTEAQCQTLRTLVEQPAWRSFSNDMSLFLVFATMLLLTTHAVTGQRRQRLGVPSHARNDAARRETLGLFVSVGFIDVEIDPQQSVAELVRNLVRETTRTLMNTHAGAQTPEIYQSFSASANLIRANMATFDGMNLQIEWHHTGYADPGTQLDLHVTDFAASNAWELLIDTADSAFGEQQRHWLQEHLQVCLQAIIDDSEQRIADICLLPVPLQQQWLHTPAANPLPAPAHAGLSQHISAMAAQHPDRIALRCGDETMSYSVLESRSNQLAHWLLQHPTSAAATPLILCLRRQPALVVWMLAALKAGRCYVPVDPQWPASRQHVILNDTGSELVVADSDSWQQPNRATAQVLAADMTAASLPDTVPDRLHPDAELAYLIYTSGSTGTPKGVMVDQRGMYNYVRWAAAEFHQQQAVDYALYSSIAFDLTVTCIFVPLMTGGAVHIHPENQQSPGLEVQQVVLDDRVDVLDCTPAHLSLAVDALQRANRRNTNVKVIILGGEEVKRAVVEQARDWFSSETVFINEYGPTEVVVGCTVHRYDPQHDTQTSVPIGIAAASTRLYVLNDSLQACGIGVVGELCIARDALAQGYWRDAELTRARFVPNPFVDGETLYRSGDLARWNSAGKLEFLGRADAQVKLNGTRIELGEVEQVLLQLPAVSAAVAALLPVSPTRQQLVAYIVTDAVLDEAALRQHASQHLLRSAVPSRFIKVASIPVTSLGKTDWHALAEVPLPVVNTAYRAAVTPLQLRLASIWADVLEHPRVGLDDNFHDLGGNSMLALRLVGAAGAAGLPLTIEEILEFGTIESITAAWEAKSRRPASASASALTSAPADGIDGNARQQVQQWFDARANVADAVQIAAIAPLTGAQSGILFHCILDPDESLYAAQLRCDLHGPLDVDVVKDSWQQLLQRHAALRSVFVHHGLSEPLQVVLAGLELPWHFETLDAADDAAPGNGAEQQGATAADANIGLAALDAIAGQQMSRPWRLDQGPLLRVALVRVQEQHHHLIIDSHHIAVDGLSTRILFDEFQEIYHARAGGTEAALPATGRFADYATALYSRSDDSRFWTRQLQGFEQPTRAVLLPKIDAAVKATDSCELSLSSACLSGLQAIAREARVTLSTTVQLAWAEMLARYNDNDDVVFGYAVSNRPASSEQDANTVGMFVNTLPLRCQCGPQRRISDALQEIQHSVAQQLQHGSVAPAAILRCSGLPAGAALFDSLLVFQPFAHGMESTREQLTISNCQAHENIHLPLTVEVFPGDELDIKALFNPQVVSTATVDTLLSHFTALLESLAQCNARQATLGDLAMMSPQETAQLQQWGEGALPVATAVASLHARFMAQVAVSPDAVALRQGSTDISYSALAEQATAVARYLIASGVSGGDTVAVCFSRSLTMWPAMLGVMLSGARYLPLDSTYPVKRLEYMLGDAAARMILTDAHTADLLQERDFAVAGIPLLRLDTDAAVIAEAASVVSDAQLQTAGDAVQDAYIMYTSGSTGLPKGVVGTHGATLNRFQWMWQAYPFSGADVCCQKTALGFVDSVWELFGPLLQGVATVLIPDDDVLDIFRFVDRLEQHRVTRLVIVPSYLAVLLEADEQLARRLAALTECVVSGEPLPPHLAERFMQVLPECRLVNLYGSTEVTADVTACEVSLEPDSVRMPIGRAIDGVRMHILDTHLRPMPPGAIGELCVSGLGLSAGYHGLPELNAEKFVASPIDSPVPESSVYLAGPYNDGRTLFRTGDLGRFRDDGLIEHFGRRDSQIKIRGQRIETAEIEQVLIEQTLISKAMVMLMGTSSLVAFCEVGDAELETAQVREVAARQLPAHMLPERIYAVATMPVLPNGKIDRQQLRAIAAADADAEESYRPPQTAVEQTLATVWSDVLDVEDVSTAAHLFDLGGNSIAAMQIMVGCEKAGLRVGLRDVLHSGSIAELAQRAVPIDPAAAASDAPVQTLDTAIDDLAASTTSVVDTVRQDNAVELMPEQLPQSPNELALAAIWQQVLARETIGIDQDFYSLGGNSIAAMQIMVGARKSGLSISLQQILAQPTIAALAEVAEPLVADTEGGQVSAEPDEDLQATLERIFSTHPGIGGRDNVLDVFRLTPSQKGILFHILLSGLDQPLYIAQVRCDLKGTLQLEPFERSWQYLVARHDALRTVIVHEGLQEPAQVTVEDAELPWHFHDFSDIEESRQREALKQLSDELLTQPISLDNAPLLRVNLVRLEADRYHLMVDFHHILMDGWSLSLLSMELLSVYESLCKQQTPELPPCGSFRDHVKMVNAQDRDQVRSFWQQQLQGFQSATSVTDVTPSGESHHATANYRLRLDREITTRLQQLSLACRVTPNTLFQAAWGLLLSRYNSTQDVLFGFAVTGRSSGISNYESTVGMFVNSLPMRLDCDPQRKLVEWLRAIQMQQAELVQYENSALVDIQQASNLSSSQQLFDSLMVFQNIPGSVVGEELPFEIENREGHENSHMPFTLEVFPGEEYEFLVLYIAEMFSEHRVRDVMSHLLNILKSMAVLEHDTANVGDVSMMSSADVHKMNLAFNHTAMDYPSQHGITDLVWQQAAATPERIAASFGDRQLSYAELTDRAARLATRLSDMGAAPDVLIGVCLPRTLDLLITLLAIQHAGAAYLPLDPDYPQSRIDYILGNADVPLLVTESALHTEDAAHSATVLLLDQQQPEIDACEPLTAGTAANPDSLAYVIYTSGSTGLPKGVRLTRRNVCNFVCSMQQTPGIAADDVMLAVTTVAFDIAVLELYLPLICGARVDIAPRDMTFDGYALADRMQQLGVTMMQATPTTWRLLLAAGWPQSNPADPQDFKALVGGEALPRDLAAQLIPNVGELWNMYGPTETTVWSTCEQITDADGLISIGKPIGNTQIYIVDTNMALCPVNVPGELCIGGDGVSGGYVKRDELTAEKFIDNPFDDNDTQRIYRTGDVARWLPDGRLECLGRMDSQVKLRGYRIELGEIESRLASRDDIEQAVVNLHQNNDLEMLVAYIVVKPTDDADVNTEAAGAEAVDDAPTALIDEAQVRDYLRQHLPYYMIPGAFVVMDALPLTPNGKIDRKALPAPGGEGGQLIAGSADADLPENQPLGEAEEQLHDIFCDVLKREQLSVNAHFFDLGGNSIVAMQIMAAAQERGIQLSLLQIFEIGTIRDLIAAATMTTPDSSSSPVASTGSTEPGHDDDDLSRISDLLNSRRRA